jgi:hypothetical protein
VSRTICMYVCMYTPYIHTCTYTMYTYHVYACMYLWMHVYNNDQHIKQDATDMAEMENKRVSRTICMYVCMYTPYIHTCTYTMYTYHVYACMHLWMHVYNHDNHMYVCMYVYTIYTYMYIHHVYHVHACMHLWMHVYNHDQHIKHDATDIAEIETHTHTCISVTHTQGGLCHVCVCIYVCIYVCR